MEYLEESLDEWLGDELEAFGEDDYVVFDCPGQIELYTNTSVFRSFIRFLQSAGWQVGRLLSLLKGGTAGACDFECRHQAEARQTIKRGNWCIPKKLSCAIDTRVPARVAFLRQPWKM